MEGIASTFDKFGIVIGLMILIISAIVYLFITMQNREKDHDKQMDEVRDKYDEQLKETTKQIERNNITLEETKQVIQNNNKAFETLSGILQEVLKIKG